MRGININDLPERYQKQIQRQFIIPHGIPGKIAYLEPNPGNALLAKEKTARFNGQVDISFLEKRHRLADPDGSSIKYVLDSLVSCGVLQGDSAKEIRKVNKEQVKIDKNEHEETVIEIWET
jgi:hypothetical protein